MPRTLPATPLDEAFLDLRAVSVLSVHLEIRVTGHVDTARLAAALATAADAHPMARARPAPERPWALHARWALDAPLAVEVVDDVTVAREVLQSRLPDDRAVSVMVARDGEGDVVAFRFHHAAIDGRGALRFVASVVDAYAGRPLPDDGLAHARDLRRLAGARGASDVAARAAKIASDAWGRAGLTRIAGDGGEDGPHHALVTRRLEPAVVKALRKSKPEGATLNDCLLAAHLRTVVAWNERRGGRVGRSVSVMMPVDLRADGEVVANLASYVAIVVPTRDLADPGSAIAAVSAQTRAVKERGTAGWIADVLSVLVVPRGVKRVAPRLLPLVEGRFVESTILSNLGPASFGDLGEAGAVREVRFSPPVLSPRMAVTLGVVGHDDGLTLTWRSLRRQVGAAGVAEFAEVFLERLDATTRDRG
ncbi:hypothetical protein [Actinomycetospora corticicola]|uniref:NRPS condensation-like uncharacterized protein n=1 Tax=Actinomycetospora corticicola TaxID=663602 RepID=A0A7Y9DSN3_9PSEU|nr:hypothetical protein [Actinomycetospora corticicola]NYD34649.1 NRPS condensation-like uncharacterized protein [Actinomycetospora corticicola]